MLYKAEIFKIENCRNSFTEKRNCWKNVDFESTCFWKTVKGLSSNKKSHKKKQIRGVQMLNTLKKTLYFIRNKFYTK